MDCLRVDKKNHRVIPCKCPIPTLIEGEDTDKCVIRVTLSGVCGTDLHIIEDKFPTKDKVTLGHEFVGVITEVSATEEETFKVGDRVAVNPNITCGVCDECRRGLPNFCTEGGMKYTAGISIDGGWAGYCKIRTSLVYKLPDSLKFEQAVLAEPLSCITHSFDKMPTLAAGANILVIGAGIIGLLFCSLLHFFGHRHVVVVQSSPARRKTFHNLGLGFQILSWDEIESQGKVNPWKFDMVIDTSGNANAMTKSMPLLRPGGTLVIFGVSDPSKTMTISPFDVYKKELTIVGTAINTNTSFQKALDLLQVMGEKYFSFDKLNLQVFPIKDHELAIEQLNAKKFTKIVFDCK